MVLLVLLERVARFVDQQFERVLVQFAFLDGELLDLGAMIQALDDLCNRSDGPCPDQILVPLIAQLPVCRKALGPSGHRVYGLHGLILGHDGSHSHLPGTVHGNQQRHVGLL